MKNFSLLVFLFCFSILSLQADVVVCIHGFLTNSKTMIPISRFLNSEGYDVYSWDYPSRRKTIEEHALDLALYLKEIALCRPNESIHFVCHSIGGLILKSALNLLSCPDNAKKGHVVLIATPSQGSRFARSLQDCLPLQVLVGPKCGWEMLNKDGVCLNRLGSFPPAMPVLVIAGTKGTKMLDTPNDGLLHVEETYLNTPFYFLSFPYSHGQLLKIKPVMYAILKFIQHGYI